MGELQSEDEDQERVNYSDEEGGFRVDEIYIPPPPKPACSFENTGPRIIITKIVNDFFKSYGREVVVGPFHKCFNGIVGPNGSGKSNVIDSLLFVFGYRASKIRSKKVSVLIHNSEKHQNVQSCTVEVHFVQIVDKPGEEYEVIPGSEFVITRTALKDNSSYYTINKRRVQFKEVATLLKKHGVDLDHNRFLILQGEVEQISMMEAKAASEHDTGMLEYLEDIIGTTRYKEPLEKLLEKVDFLEEKRMEKVNRLKLVETEVSTLKGPMEEAVGFLKLENSIIQKKNYLYQKHIFDLDERIKEMEESNSELFEGHKELLEKMRIVKEEKTKKESDLKEQSEEYNSLHKRKNNLKEAYDKANNKDMQIKADMEQLNQQRKKTKESLAEENKKLLQYENVPSESERDIRDIEKREKEVAADLEKAEEEKVAFLARVREETMPLQEKKAVVQTELVKLNKIVDEKRSSVALAESELKLYISNEETEKKKLENLQNSVQASEDRIAELSEQIPLLKRKIPATEKSLNEANQELHSVKVEEARIRDEIIKKRGKIEESRSSMQASRSRGRVLDSLMKQKADGNCPGLFGRLGDLGAIDQKYDVAVSTACGGLDNIVVDTVDTATWCIEYLKKYNIGRATFIALDKQEHFRRQVESTINTPERVPRLFDLIKVEDERVKTAFYFSLRDTLVANDLDQASRIAYGAQRYRVVTLAGQLIEMSGTMSGGGNSVSRGRMGQSVAVSTTQSTVDIESMEEELNELSNSVREYRQKQTQLESQINALKPELREMKINYDKYTVEFNGLKQQLPALKKQLNEQEAKANATKADKKEVKRLEKIVEEKKELYECALSDTVEFQAEVDRLTAEINDKTKGKREVIEKKIQNLSKTLNKCRAEITRLKVGVKTAANNVTKSKAKIANMETEIKNAEDGLRQMKAKRDEIEGDVKNLMKCIQEISEQISEQEESYSELKAEVASLVKMETKLKADQIEFDEKIKKYKRVMETLKGETVQWRAKLSRLKLQDIPYETVEPLQTYNEEELGQTSIENVQKVLQSMEDKMKNSKPNLNTITEYQKKMALCQERTRELVELSNRKTQVKEHYDNLRVRRKEEFTTGYNIIRRKLKEAFQTITLGGDADLEMVDSFDPFTDGIRLTIRPPRKAWTSIPNLSGGEKTLSSLSLVFALHYFKPSPIYVMDEIDSALDFKNNSIIGNYIKERTKNAQFLLISLRPETYSLSHRLVGIYKTFSTTKTITYDPNCNSTNGKENGTEEESPVVQPEPADSQSVSASPSADSMDVDDSLPSTNENVNGEVIDDSMSL